MKLEEVILGTGNYEFTETGNRLSIDKDGGNSWCFYGNTYKKLAPELSTYRQFVKSYRKLQSIKKETEEYIRFKKQIEDEFIKNYYKSTLRKLNADKLLEDLNREFGKDIILLTNEDIFEFSHRRLVADYIELETGIYIPEVIVSREGKVREYVPRSYKDRLQRVIEKDEN